MGILSCNGRRELYCCRIWLDDFSQREEEVKQSMHQQANTGQIRRRGYRCNWLSIRCRGTGGGAVVDWVVDRKIVWRTKAQSRRLGATDRCQDIDQPPRTPGRKRRNVNRCSARSRLIVRYHVSGLGSQDLNPHGLWLEDLDCIRNILLVASA